MNVTDALGELSPVLRNCYKIGGQLEANWDPYWKQWESYPVWYAMVKKAVMRNYTNIDNISNNLWDDTKNLDLPAMSFGYTRDLYLLFF